MTKPSTRRSPAKSHDVFKVAEPDAAIENDTGTMPDASPVETVSPDPADAAPESMVPPQKTRTLKPKKPKLVRDSFKIPENEYEAIAELKTRCLEGGVAVKKSELLRAGLMALQALGNQKLLKLIGKLEKIKTGRPAG